MPSLRLTNTTVTVHLDTGEKIGALSRDIVIPRSAITEVEPIGNPIAVVRGIRAPGLDVPGRVKAGTWRRRGGAGADASS